MGFLHTIFLSVILTLKGFSTVCKARRIFLRAFDLCLGGDYAAIAPIRASSCALLQALSGWKLLPETAPICFAQSAGCA